MNKKVFMNSMISASETIMKLGITGDRQKSNEAALVVAATALAEKEVADKGLPEDEVEAATKEAVDLAVEKAKEGVWGEALCKKSEEAFILVNRSIRAFYMVNKKEKWEVLDYDDNLVVFKRMFGAVGSAEDMKKNVINLAGMLEEEVVKHKADTRASHDNGKAWKKDKNDIKRFEGLVQCVKDFQEIVS